ncbi:MAG TPA: gamma-glutamyltransferase family protein [Steroidobacteraceae bacterium]|jgi:gamma-glutamyltranspeptidase/glutathione hydrolase|nr:gamma-glutamyltransferase family protein [Steroidobacteraceae bacterium]
MQIRATLMLTTLLAAALTLVACADGGGPATHAATALASVPLPPLAAPGTLQTGQHGIVVTANPYASQAGLRVLEAGGSAVDAAVAVQAVLGLVEPQSSGLGGGAFISYFDARTHNVTVYNGRETAPAGATARMFLDDQGKPLPFPAAVLSGRSTGAPGAIAALEMAQHEHGRLPWRTLFADGERLANDGFVVSRRLERFISSNRVAENVAPDVQHYFTRPDGAHYAAGDTLRNPAYAIALQRIAARGANGLLRGPTARDIVNRVHQGELAGSLSLQDLADYRPLKSEALCRRWEHRQVCVPPPPAGGVSLLQSLLLVSQTDIATRNADDPIAWVQLGESQRLMYADRARYVADPTLTPVPTDGLLDPVYIHDRATMIGQRIAPQAPAAGDPPGAPAAGRDHSVEPHGTTNIVIVDRDGNVLCMTTTVESVFGSGRMVDGFFLNNQLTDFSFSPTEADGRPAANAVAPGKRPRSAMTPAIVLDADGRFIGAAGSAGGPAIIAYVQKTLIATFDWHLSIQDAINLPNIVAHGAGFSGEARRFSPELLRALNELGIDIHEGQFEESGLTGVTVDPDGTLHGGVDLRREGVALAY